MNLRELFSKQGALVRVLAFLAMLGPLAGCSPSKERREGPACQIAFGEIENGWVDIPAGSFVFGEPEETGCRGRYVEKQSEVTFTRAFKMAPNEVTQAQWAVSCIPTPCSVSCGPEYPVTNVNWFEVMEYLNRLSSDAGLETCYDLSTCKGNLGSGCREEGPGYCFPPVDYPEGCPNDILACVDDVFHCTGTVRKHKKPYDCRGYRLPTTAEYEYAARAGTTTHTWAGDLTIFEYGECQTDPVLDPIAWYCPRATKPMAVRQKEPNPWGLYDILGNVTEWTSSNYTGKSLETNSGQTPPLVDPVVQIEDVRRSLRGGSYIDNGCWVRAARHFSDFAYLRQENYGFRPVRTIFQE